MEESYSRYPVYDDDIDNTNILPIISASFSAITPCSWLSLTISIISSVTIDDIIEYMVFYRE